MFAEKSGDSRRTSTTFILKVSGRRKKEMDKEKEKWKGNSSKKET
jgi:hypothetical protein